MTGRRTFLKSLAAVPLAASGSTAQPVAVLTFDDAPRSHHSFVAPLLRDLGFNATFFVTHRWMDDRENFMTWEQIAEIHEMGFEIGNHSWTHANFAQPVNAARLEGELALVENALNRVGVPKPESFAWCGNGFGPEALAALRRLGYRFARRGMQPEVPYGEIRVGPVYQADVHDPLLIPTTGDAYPDWTLEHFHRVLDRSSDGVVVLQFHGVPDPPHPWVSTPPQRFETLMQTLKDRNFRVLALRDLAELAKGEPPRDPTARIRYPEPREGLAQPAELTATRADLAAWTDVMLRHRYSVEEATTTAGFTPAEAESYAARLAARRPPEPGQVEVLPYPGGGRHPRIGFLDGAIDPLRGTKASVFLPSDPESYVVVDLPELITSNLGHLFLAHTHVPTIWNDRNVWLENVDWRRNADGSLELEWSLPNNVVFGSALRPRSDDVGLELWLRNGLDEPLRGLRTQLCVMLRGAPEFNAQTVDNKIFEPPVAAVRSASGERWILTAWERTGRSWGNANCPCLHADPVFPDCEPSETVRLEGRLWFAEGPSIEEELRAAKVRYEALPAKS